jgi:uncharacterized protein YqeY
MNIKDKIQTDFISALKSGNSEVKNALSFLKAKIVEAEKSLPGKTFSDDDVLNVINKMIKQRKQSIEAYNSGGREDLVKKETSELLVLESYMPIAPTENDVIDVAKKIISEMDVNMNYNARLGRTVGEVMKYYKGLADSKMVNTIVKDLIPND